MKKTSTFTNNSKVLVLFNNKLINYTSKLFTTSNSNNTNSEYSSIIPDHISYKIPNYKKKYSLDFPWLINGAPVLDIKSRLLTDQLFSRNRSVSRRQLLNYLFKVYRGVLLAASQYDYEFLNNYLEETFNNKLTLKLKEFEKLQYEIELLEDMKAEKNKRIIPEFHLYDSIVIKGLSTNRKTNGSPDDYMICNDIEDMGFISYVNKEISNSANFSTKELGEETINKYNFSKLILRVSCIFKSGLKLFITDNLNNKLINYNSDYNFNHAAVFEAELLPLSPLVSYTKTETYTEWISKHDIGAWKIIDMDNWMKGNGYFVSSK